MNFKNNVMSNIKGKVVYWVNGVSFENDKDQRNGKEKALKYCLDNFINSNDIMKFDSRLERDRYEYLLGLQNEGKISHLQHHFVIKVQDAYVNCNGDNIPEITYEADFIYLDNLTNKRIVEDVKGSDYFIDERFITLKQVFDKVMYDKGLYIKVVMRSNKEWFEWHIGEKKKSQKLIIKQREAIRALKKEKHDREVADNKKLREIARMKELEAKSKLTSIEKKRLSELKAKYYN